MLRPDSRSQLLFVCFVGSIADQGDDGQPIWATNTKFLVDLAFGVSWGIPVEFGRLHGGNGASHIQDLVRSAGLAVTSEPQLR
jgi:hypothetical protein